MSHSLHLVGGFDNNGNAVKPRICYGDDEKGVNYKLENVSEKECLKEKAILEGLFPRCIYEIRKEITHYRIDFYSKSLDKVLEGIWFPADEEGAKHIILALEENDPEFQFWNVETR
jgi:ribosomal protein L25 (general stress protein Ctc)